MSVTMQLIGVTPQQLAELLGAPTDLNSLLRDEPDWECDLNREWMAIDYLLAAGPDGQQPPLAWAVPGDQLLGVEHAAEPVRYLSPEQVGRVAAALAGLPAAELRSRFDLDDLKTQEIYSVGDPRNDDEEEEWRAVQTTYEDMVGFSAGAAERGLAVLNIVY